MAEAPASSKVSNKATLPSSATRPSKTTSSRFRGRHQGEECQVQASAEPAGRPPPSQEVALFVFGRLTSPLLLAPSKLLAARQAKSRAVCRARYPAAGREEAGEGNHKAAVAPSRGERSRSARSHESRRRDAGGTDARGMNGWMNGRVERPARARRAPYMSCVSPCPSPGSRTAPRSFSRMAAMASAVRSVPMFFVAFSAR